MICTRVFFLVSCFAAYGNMYTRCLDLSVSCLFCGMEKRYTSISNSGWGGVKHQQGTYRGGAIGAILESFTLRAKTIKCNEFELSRSKNFLLLQLSISGRCSRRSKQYMLASKESILLRPHGTKTAEMQTIF